MAPVDLHPGPSFPYQTLAHRSFSDSINTTAANTTAGAAFDDWALTNITDSTTVDIPPAQSTESILPGSSISMFFLQLIVFGVQLACMASSIRTAIRLMRRLREPDSGSSHAHHGGRVEVGAAVPVAIIINRSSEGVVDVGAEDTIAYVQTSVGGEDITEVRTEEKPAKEVDDADC